MSHSRHPASKSAFLPVVWLAWTLCLGLWAVPGGLRGEIARIDQASSTGSTAMAGAWQYYEVEIPADSPGWRLVLAPRNGASGTATLHVRKDEPPTGDGDFRSERVGSPKTLVLDGAEASEGVWYVGVHLPEGADSEDYTLQSEIGWVRDLSWDPGTSMDGTSAFVIPDNDLGGTHHFRISTPHSSLGLWRQVLRVSSGEADLYLREGFRAQPNEWLWNSKSDRPGSDGLVSPLTAGQTWYLAVKASPGARWSLMAGGVFVTDLGTIADDGSSGSGADSLPIEGWRFFRTTIPNNAIGWRLWLRNPADGSTLEKQCWISRNRLAFPHDADRSFEGQTLVVPPYLTPGSSDAFFVAVAGEAGTAFELDSRRQEVTELPFGTLSEPQEIVGYRFKSYRIEVPDELLGLEVTTRRIAGNPDLAVRRGLVPNPGDNDAFSESGGTTDDSITLVQPDSSDGSYFVTVHSPAEASFRLQSREPTVTPIAFSSLTTNDEVDRSGWRYFSLTDIESQKGLLGWLLRLTDQQPGSAIAIRRNQLPGRHSGRSNGSIGTVERADESSSSGSLYRPNQQADIWYVGIYSYGLPLGPFTLQAGPLSAEPTALRTTRTVETLPGGEWKYYRVVVPAEFDGHTVRGWELRVSAAEDNPPGLLVRRDLLPQNSWSSGGFYYHEWFSKTSWPSGWSMYAGDSWTNRSGAPQTHVLTAGTGQPLEPGTYYIGFYRQPSQADKEFVWTSRLIGDSGSGLDYEIKPLSAGEFVEGTLQPRETTYFAVDVPEGVASQKFQLELPAGHEGRLLIRKDFLPLAPGVGGLAKQGGEYWLQLPDGGRTTLTPGRYYLMVVGEGRNPLDEWTLGSGPVSYRLKHLGEAPVGDLGTLPVGGEVHQAGSYDSGEVRLHRFTVPEGALALEVRLEDRAGNPWFAVAKGDVAPMLDYSGYWRSYYGYSSGYSGQLSSNLVTIPNPEPGVYSVAVGYEFSSTPQAGSYNLKVVSAGTLDAEPRSTQVVASLPGGEWRYYRMVVPDEVDGHVVRGWELRVSAPEGTVPALLVRRDLLPQNSGYWAGFSSDQWFSWTSWPSGWSMYAGDSWSNRSGAPQIQVLTAGMGQPLEPGTYYLGFNRQYGQSDGPFTWTSRLIGDSGSGLDYEIKPLSAGEFVEGTLAPRETAYFAVDVPEGVASQKFQLELPAGHEGRLLIRKDFLPLAPGVGGLAKQGGEYWLQLPDGGRTTLTPGRYYLMVVGEGQDPLDEWTLGRGPVSYRLKHLGEAPVGDLGTLPVSGEVHQAGRYDAGEVRLHRFTVPEGALALEVRLEDRTGNPSFAVVKGEVAPYLQPPNYSRSYYGYSSGCYGQIAPKLVTIPNPEPGVYSVAVGHDFSSALQAGSYTLKVVSIGSVDAHPRSTQVVASLPGGEWQYYRMVVPDEVDGHVVRGWELRVSAPEGAVPALQVRRDLLPENSGYWAGFSSEQWFSMTSWPSGWSMYAGDSWSNRSGAPQTQVLTAAMGQPLEPGTYYLGFYRQTWQADTEFTWTSRLIGDSGSGLDYEIRPLVAGGFGEGTLEPREAAYYVVDVPDGVASQKFQLELPAGHEARLIIRKDYLPVSNGSHNTLAKQGGEYWLQLPDGGRTTLTPGRYYLMVVGEGQDPLEEWTLGRGPVSYRLKHLGEAPVGDLGTLPLAGESAMAGSYDAGEVRLHRFTVPEGALALEVRLEDRTGNPWFAVAKGEVAPWLYNWIWVYPYGFSSGYIGQLSSSLVTIPNPEPGVYSVAVGHRVGSPPQAGSYLLRATAIGPVQLEPDGDGGRSGQLALVAGQSRYLVVDVPQEYEGEEVLGWRLSVYASFGSVRMRARQGQLPVLGAWNVQSEWREGELFLARPFLSPGRWYIEVQGVTDASVDIASSLLRDSSMVRVWSMPVAAQTAPSPGLAAGCFGDTGVLPDGSPLPDDQGVDLSAGRADFYAVDIPEGNGGLLRTVLEALGGNPDLYIRPHELPSKDHVAWVGAQSWTPSYMHRLDGTGQTQYGAWVPYDVNSATSLEPGRWYLMVRAEGGTNARYRLRLSHASQPQVRDLALDGGSFTGEILAGGDWRYYRVRMPEDPSAMPLEWRISFDHTLGSVVVYLRDSAPPGSYETDVVQEFGSWWFPNNPRDWYTDNLDPGGYRRLVVPGAHMISGHHLRPGKTYYLGFRATSDSVFSVTSSTGASTLDSVFGHIDDLNAAGGTAKVTLAPGETRTWRIESPAEATRWRHFATHVGGVRVFLREDFLPAMDWQDRWQSQGVENSGVTMDLYGQARARTFYLSAVNQGEQAADFSLTVDYRRFRLTLTQDEGGFVLLDPQLPPDGCYDPGQLVTLTAWPYSLKQFNGWSGDVEGMESPVSLVMDGDKSLAAHFGTLQHQLVLSASGGSITANPAKPTYDHDEVVELVAVPEPGNEFVSWSVPLAGSDNPARVNVTSDLAISAVFAPVFDSAKLSETGLVFDRSSAGASWYLQDEYRPEGALLAARSANTADYSSSWIETIVSGPGTLRYWRKVSSHWTDYLLVSVDGNPVSWLNGEQDWALETIVLGAGTHTVRWTYVKDGWGSEGLDAAFIAGMDFEPTRYKLGASADHGVVAAAPLKDVYSYGETVELMAQPEPGYEFIRWDGDLSGSGNPVSLTMDRDLSITAVFRRGWDPVAICSSGLALARSDGADAWYLQGDHKPEGALLAARSGNTADSSSSWIETTVTGPGTLRYWRKVSSEEGCDHLLVSLDGSIANALSGECDWAIDELTIPSGEHLVRWQYAKDGSVARGIDAAFVAGVVFTPAPGYDSWEVLSHLAPGNRGPLDRNGPLDLPNLLAYAMGLDPLMAEAGDLPQLSMSGDGTLVFRHRRAKFADDVQLEVLGSTDPAGGTWVRPDVIEQRVIDRQDHEIVEAVVRPPAGGRYFLRLDVAFR